MFQQLISQRSGSLSNRGAPEVGFPLRPSRYQQGVEQEEFRGDPAYVPEETPWASDGVFSRLLELQHDKVRELWRTNTNARMHFLQMRSRRGRRTLRLRDRQALMVATFGAATQLDKNLASVVANEPAAILGVLMIRDHRLVLLSLPQTRSTPKNCHLR